jgi:hypothetical protein
VNIEVNFEFFCICLLLNDRLCNDAVVWKIAMKKGYRGDRCIYKFAVYQMLYLHTLQIWIWEFYDIFLLPFINLSFLLSHVLSISNIFTEINMCWASVRSEHRRQHYRLKRRNICSESLNKPDGIRVRYCDEYNLSLRKKQVFLLHFVNLIW